VTCRTRDALRSRPGADARLFFINKKQKVAALCAASNLS